MLPFRAFPKKKAFFYLDNFSYFRVVLYLAVQAVSGLHSLRSLLRPAYDVCFYAFYKQEKDCYIRVGCCESHRREEMRNDMTIHGYKVIDFHTFELKSDTNATVSLKGYNETGIQILV